MLEGATTLRATAIRAKHNLVFRSARSSCRYYLSLDLLHLASQHIVIVLNYVSGVDVVVVVAAAAVVDLTEIMPKEYVMSKKDLGKPLI